MNAEPRDGTSLPAAIEWLNQMAGSMCRWLDSVRPEDGSRGRFHWARETTRQANVAATAYILMGLNRMSALGLLTDEDRRDGITWVEGLHVGDQHYHDPAILDRRPPDWPAHSPFPDPPLLVVVNQYSQSVLRHLDPTRELPPAPPPEGIPQVHEADQALEYVRTRPWETGPWGAGSHSMRMGTWLLQWYREGRIPLDPLVDVLRWLYAHQNPETGLWGGAGTPAFQRINGTFKLFPLLCEELRLPLPHADRIIDQVLAEWERPDYDAHVGACDEWDNLYVIANARGYTDHRAEEIREWAIRRLNRLSIFRKPDGGFSYGPEVCVTHWCGVDMAPAIPQSDCMGLGILSAAIAVCVDILGIEGQTPWTAGWRMRKPVPQELTDTLCSHIW